MARQRTTADSGMHAAASHRGDVGGRVAGMIVFALGVGLLLLVFRIAYGLFTLPPADALGLHFTGDAKKDPQIPAIGAQFMWLLLRIAYLCVMSVAGSLVANKGVNFYFSALQGAPIALFGKRHAPGPHEEEPAAH